MVIIKRPKHLNHPSSSSSSSSSPTSTQEGGGVLPFGGDHVRMPQLMAEVGGWVGGCLFFVLSSPHPPTPQPSTAAHSNRLLLLFPSTHPPQAAMFCRRKILLVNGSHTTLAFLTLCLRQPRKSPNEVTRPPTHPPTHPPTRPPSPLAFLTLCLPKPRKSPNEVTHPPTQSFCSFVPTPLHRSLLPPTHPPTTIKQKTGGDRTRRTRAHLLGQGKVRREGKKNTNKNKTKHPPTHPPTP